MPFVRLVSVALVAAACSSGITTVRVTPAPRQSFVVASVAPDSAPAAHPCIAADSAGKGGCALTGQRSVAHAFKP
jgi:hypothetical protein